MLQTIQSMKAKDERGFTLIELLIVVAIIGILASIAVPALLGTREKAKVKAITASGETAVKEIQEWMNSVASQEPIVYVSDATGGLSCSPHNNKQTVDADGDGIPEARICAQRYPNATEVGPYQVSASTDIEAILAFYVAQAGFTGKNTNPWDSGVMFQVTVSDPTPLPCSVVLTAMNTSSVKIVASTPEGGDPAYCGGANIGEVVVNATVSAL